MIFLGSPISLRLWQLIRGLAKIKHVETFAAARVTEKDGIHCSTQHSKTCVQECPTHWRLSLQKQTVFPFKQFSPSAFSIRVIKNYPIDRNLFGV